MLRLLVVALILVFVITLVRAFSGALRQAFLDAAKSGRPAGGAGSPPKTAEQGELKQDPVCGTFVPAATAFRKVVHGETHYFCSAGCRDRFELV